MRIEKVVVICGVLAAVLALPSALGAGSAQAGEKAGNHRKIIIIVRPNTPWTRRRVQRYTGFKRLYRGQRYTGFKKVYSGPRYLTGSY